MRYQKYHGLGNDFIICEYEENLDYRELAKRLCQRKINIGADGLIVVKTNPLEMMFFNQDGSEAKMCGNGIRCFAHYCYLNQLVNMLEFEVVTKAGILTIKITAAQVSQFQVEVMMGIPLFNKESISLSQDYQLPLTIDGREVYSLFMGTIHSVVFVDEIDSVKLEKVGKNLESHSYFKDRTNVNFVKVIDKDNIEVLTYERGVGYTFACGTGCCASAVIANYYKRGSDTVLCHLKHGSLKIKVEDQVYMTGPSEFVNKGEVYV